jgi:hypothetical protein
VWQQFPKALYCIIVVVIEHHYIIRPYFGPAHPLTRFPHPSPHYTPVFCMSPPFSRLGIHIRPRGQRGELDEDEKWWAERQKALEQAGYMLRPRYHSDRKFSWAGTDKSYLDFEDGKPLMVSEVIFYQ